MKLLLIDGSNLIFRAYYATENLKMINPEGIPVNAINTLISMINKLIKDTKPTHIFIALDTGKSTFRHEMYPDYKGKRSETPDALKQQFPLAKDLYEAMGIKYGYTDDFEADDLIASYAETAKKKGFEVLVFSGDKDLLQLIDDNVRVMTPKIGFSKAINYDIDTFVEKYTFKPERFLEYKALVGDSSDNIIGVPGVGDKTAKKLINEFASLDDILHEAESGRQTKKIWMNIKDNATRIKENMVLVDLVTNVNPEFVLEDFLFNGFNLESFVPFLRQQGFDKLYSSFSKNIKNNVNNSQFDIKDSFDLNDLNPNMDTYIIPIFTHENYILNPVKSFIVKNNNNFYYLTKHNDELCKLLVSNLPKITYNLKVILGTLGLFEYNNIKSDIFIAASLLDNTNFKKNISLILFEYGLSDNPNASIDLYLENDIKGNVSSILENIEALFCKIQMKIEDANMQNVLYKIELPLTKVLAKMELDGVFIDENALEHVLKQYSQMLENSQIKLEEYCDINFNSGKQLSEFLFIDKGLPTKKIKKNKNGFSTDVNSLEILLNNISSIEDYQDEIIFIKELLEYRKIKKIHSTYLVGLKRYIKDGMIHPIINQLLTDTGRLSIIEPNIQNMPIRTTEGRIIRSFFNSGNYKYVVAIDYSQVELRVIAHLANEEHMIKDFNSNLDIHQETAKKIFNLEEVNSSVRSQAKAINFGIIYGMSKYGLAKQVGISNEQADIFIDKYLQTYPNIKKYMQDQITQAKLNNYVETEFGRRRILSSINSNNYNEVENAKRIAINSPVQGTAADIMKLAMIKTFEFIKDNDDVRLAMQIHDELVFYVNDLAIIPELKKVFESVVDYEIELLADASYGNNWLECK